MDKHTLREIKLLTADLEVGDSSRVLCPACGGGRSEEVSLSVHRKDDGGVVFHCFRASCDCAGGYGGTYQAARNKPPAVAHKVWEGETTDLPTGAEAWLIDNWCMDVPEHWYWTEDMGGRLAMSIRSPQNTHRGWVLRHIGPRPVRTKAYTYFCKPGTPKASWYTQRGSPNMVLVEDIPSAVRASEYMTAVALMGTRVTEDVALEIAEHRPPGKVVVALDADATAEGIEIARRFGLLWDDVGVAILTKDLKDQTEEELCQTIQNFPS